MIRQVSFLAALIIAGLAPLSGQEAASRTGEPALWEDFQQVMNGSDNAGWLYASRAEDEPADLGYWIEYRITRAYYERAAEKREAIREILTIRDFSAFLAASGYAGGG